MIPEQRERLAYLREDLLVWQARREKCRFSLALHNLYCCSAMDRALGEMLSEKNRLEEEERKCPTKQCNGRRRAAVKDPLPLASQD